ncbi:MAG: molecular chaperone TorD family protein [Deltaproteobacteria bacterium]|nr:molecular chaperone TorD family protein [Deltaproteobacteria bacterium]
MGSVGLPDPIRRDLYLLLGALLSEAPDADTLEALRREQVLATLADAVERHLGRPLHGLHAMRTALDAPGAEDVQRDHQRLFQGPGKLAAPPWESVYRSPDRLVMQGPARDVLAAYVASGLGYDDMTQCPPDHVARELGFVATLVDRRLSGQGESVETEREFFAAHVASWVPLFSADLARAAHTPFMRGVAVALGEVVELDAGSMGVPLANAAS